uniref:Uncharacterized protein n=1 Tax=Anguilla anguilla TaxID=7936 RepID=A0A0E9X220_ANGAN
MHGMCGDKSTSPSNSPDSFLLLFAVLFILKLGTFCFSLHVLLF